MLKTNCAHASVRVDLDNTSRKFALEERNDVVRPEIGMFLIGYYYYQDCLYWLCVVIFRGMLHEVYVRIAENMKVKRPIEDTRLTLTVWFWCGKLTGSETEVWLWRWAWSLQFSCYVILVNLPNNEYFYNYIIFIVFYKGAVNIAASIHAFYYLY